jgi:multidrug resistance efflux pump
MKLAKTVITALALGLAIRSGADPDPKAPAPSPAEATKAAPDDSASRADRRYDEMLGRMQAAVEEIAQLYGNPTFLQVFTNDAERASELRQRLKAVGSREQMDRQAADLEKTRQALMDDIALKERQVQRLSARLVRQRAALDALEAAVEQARKAVEETAP